jgi:GT2 family glycosyltransferase
MTIMPSSEENVSCLAAGAIGAVVIGRNEGDRLIRCLDSLSDRVAKIVYVDSASSDGSSAKARAKGATVIELMADVALTAARGRRIGLERLLQELPDCRFVQFIDGDCVMQDGWLRKAATFLEAHTNCGAVCGRRFEAHPQDSLYNQIIDREWATAIGEAKACGGDSLMRVQALQEVGSFRADLLAGEEPELCTRLRAGGWTIWRIDVPMTQHDAGISHLSQWLRRARRGGTGYAQVWSITRSNGSPIYARQVASALLWVLMLPVLSIAFALTSGQWQGLLFAPALWALQIARLALRDPQNDDLEYRLKSAALLMLTKLAETAGILTWWFGSKRQETSYRDQHEPSLLNKSAR